MGLLLFGLSAITPAATAAPTRLLAATPPMGWNDWAHYQCDFTAQTILDDAHELVKTGLAARGYNTVTIDDCWMQKNRAPDGNLQPDPKRFPHGMKPVVQAVHALGLKFGIYEDAGSETCGGFAGSGRSKDGGPAHFLQDTRLFAAWGVDYLKLDGCNLYVSKGETRLQAYRAAYREESRALQQAGRPIVFSESAPAYFQGSPQWYDVLSWVRAYGQLWREGTDIATFSASNPGRPRFSSVQWNYLYNLPLGRFQSPGHWNDADFIIAGDSGLTLAESRTQLALWSMMSAPLILSSNLAHLSPAAIALLSNKEVLAVDQDPLGRMATLLRRSAALDVLFKPLQGGNFAVAVLNRSAAPLHIELRPGDLGFPGKGCRLDARNLWNGTEQPAIPALRAAVDPHDTVIWRIRPSSSCGAPARRGVITRIVPDSAHRAESYTRCLASPGKVEPCAGTAAEVWTVSPAGELQSGGKCLTAGAQQAALQACRSTAGQRWRHTLAGNLVAPRSGLCLTATGAGDLALEKCGHNLPTQIWSLPHP